MLRNEDDVPAGWYLKYHQPEKATTYLPLKSSSVELNRNLCPTQFISRKHAVLAKNCTEDKWSIKDLGSMNGTYVNMVQISEQTLLGVDDIITLGVISDDLNTAPHFVLKLKTLIQDSHTSEEKRENQGTSGILTTVKNSRGLSPEKGLKDVASNLTDNLKEKLLELFPGVESITLSFPGQGKQELKVKPEQFSSQIHAGPSSLSTKTAESKQASENCVVSDVAHRLKNKSEDNICNRERTKKTKAKDCIPDYACDVKDKVSSSDDDSDISHNDKEEESFNADGIESIKREDSRLKKGKKQPTTLNCLDENLMKTHRSNSVSSSSESYSSVHQHHTSNAANSKSVENTHVHVKSHTHSKVSKSKKLSLKESSLDEDARPSQKSSHSGTFQKLSRTNNEHVKSSTKYLASHSSNEEEIFKISRDPGKSDQPSTSSEHLNKTDNSCKTFRKPVSHYSKNDSKSELKIKKVRKAFPRTSDSESESEGKKRETGKNSKGVFYKSKKSDSKNTKKALSALSDSENNTIGEMFSHFSDSTSRSEDQRKAVEKAPAHDSCHKKNIQVKKMKRLKRLISRTRPCVVSLQRCDSPCFRLEKGITVPWKRKREKSVKKLFAELKQIIKAGIKRKPSYLSSSDEQILSSKHSSSSSDESASEMRFQKTEGKRRIYESAPRHRPSTSRRNHEETDSTSSACRKKHESRNSSSSSDVSTSPKKSGLSKEAGSSGSSDNDLTFVLRKVKKTDNIKRKQSKKLKKRTGISGKIKLSDSENSTKYQPISRPHVSNTANSDTESSLSNSSGFESTKKQKIVKKYTHSLTVNQTSAKIQKSSSVDERDSEEYSDARQHSTAKSPKSRLTDHKSSCENTFLAQAAGSQISGLNEASVIKSKKPGKDRTLENIKRKITETLERNRVKRKELKKRATSNEKIKTSDSENRTKHKLISRQHVLKTADCDTESNLSNSSGDDCPNEQKIGSKYIHSLTTNQTSAKIQKSSSIDERSSEENSDTCQHSSAKMLKSRLTDRKSNAENPLLAEAAGSQISGLYEASVSKSKKPGKDETLENIERKKTETLERKRVMKKKIKMKATSNEKIKTSDSEKRTEHKLISRQLVLKTADCDTESNLSNSSGNDCPNEQKIGSKYIHSLTTNQTSAKIQKSSSVEELSSEEKSDACQHFSTKMPKSRLTDRKSSAENPLLAEAAGCQISGLNEAFVSKSKESQSMEEGNVNKQPEIENSVASDCRPGDKNSVCQEQIPREVNIGVVVPIKKEPEDIKPDIKNIKVEVQDPDDFPMYSQRDAEIFISSDDDNDDCLEEIPVMPMIIKKEPEVIYLDDDDDNDNVDALDFYDDTEAFFPDLSQSILDEIEFEDRQEELKRLEEEEKVAENFKEQPEPSTSSHSIKSNLFYSAPDRQVAKRKTCDTRDIYSDTGDFFPELSQALIDEIADEDREEHIRSFSNRMASKRPRTVGVTDARPLPSRPAGSFGRGEIQRRDSREEPWLTAAPQRKPFIEKTQRKQSVSDKGKKQSKLSKIKHDFIQNRVPIPRGGSDVRKTINEFKIPKLKSKPSDPKSPSTVTSHTVSIRENDIASKSANIPTTSKARSVFDKQQTSRLDSFIESFQKPNNPQTKSQNQRKANTSSSSTSVSTMTKKSLPLDRQPTNIFAKPISKVFPMATELDTPLEGHSSTRETSTITNSTSANNSNTSTRRVHFNIPSNASTFAKPPPQQYPSNHLSAPGVSRAVSEMNHFQKIVHQIVFWNRMWLDEQDGKKGAPPVAKPHTCKRIAHTYDSAEEYLSTYYPLLLYEMWASLFTHYKEAKEEPKFSAAIEVSRLVNEHIVELHCKIRVITNASQPNQSPLMLTEGMILEIIYSILEGNKKAPQLGYVFNIRLEPSPDPKYKIQKIGLYVRKSQLKIDLSKHVTLRKIGNERTYIRQAESLAYLGRSEMSAGILNPELVVKGFRVDPRIKLKVLDKFNSTQRQFILHTATTVYHTLDSPQIVLIQGPPGTGKTFLITGIIQQLFFGRQSKENFRILVVAPSNAAVDEIGRRLVSLRKHCKITKSNQVPNFVRVGQTHMMHPEVRDYSLDSLLRKNYHDQERKRRRLVEESDKLTKEITGLRVHLNHLHSNPIYPAESIRKTQDQLYSRQRKLSDYESLLEGYAKAFNNDRQIKRNLLEKADIFLSTLNSCRQSFPPHYRFTCCIVDEATQCSEPELLSPLLAFGITKLVLVGDPQQLPATVKSVEAAEHGYSLSMFERMFHKVKASENKVLMLKDQYRMHLEICSFPSREFYDDSLITKYTTSLCPLQPYVIFDLKDSQETNDPTSSSISNNREANFVTQLCSEILKVTFNKYSIGIITPYRDQVKQIAGRLGNNHNIEVNTVDGFQGREKDVIVLSCVRSNITGNIGFLNNRNRLNVALTRASHCLVICGNLLSLSIKDHTWQRLIKDAQHRKVLHTTTTSVPVDNLVKKFLLKT